MIVLYDSPFSPFARKVRMVLEHKRLAFDTVDALALANRAELAKLNWRIEVPALTDEAVTVVNSADIVAYLEHRYPDFPVLPADAGQRVIARDWERCSDTVIDAITVDLSLWLWSDRKDKPPPGLQEAGRRDLAEHYARMEAQLGDQDYFVGDLSIADIALYPHLKMVKLIGAPIEPTRFPRLKRWLQRMDELDICKADVQRVKDFMQGIERSQYEFRRIAWRGDRLEWVMRRGFHAWFAQEIEQGRVMWPGEE